MWGGIPDGWRVVKLKRAVYIPTGLVDPENEEFASLRLIAPNHVESNTGRLVGEESAEDQGASSGKFLVEAGEVIYSKIRPALNKACLAPEQCLCSADMYPMRPTENLLAPKFLLYALLSQPFLHRAVDESMRVAMPKINRDSLGSLDIPLPPVPTQRAIASFLDHETEKIDTLIGKKRQLLDLLEEKRTALITRAVTRGLNPGVPLKDSGVEWMREIPEHWDAGPIKRVARLATGHTPSRSEPDYWTDCTIPWITLSDVGQLRREPVEYLYDTKEKISVLGLRNSSAELLPEGTVVLSRTASVGFSTIMGRPMATTQDFANWVCGDLILPEFLLYVFRGMKQEFSRIMMGSTHQTIYMPAIRALATPLPPISEQEQIVAHIRQSISGMDRMRDTLTRSISLLQEYRSALISAAVTGKIDVRDKIPA